MPMFDRIESVEAYGESEEDWPSAAMMLAAFNGGVVGTLAALAAALCGDALLAAIAGSGALACGFVWRSQLPAAGER